jgi:hypothetical protein
VTPATLEERIRAQVADTRRQQGLPECVEDVGVLTDLAGLLAEGGDPDG